jgi:sarcosine oxidase, subunit beta
VTQTADVVIIGAGIIGGSIAFHLLERDPRLRVVVLEKEAEPGTGATSKATGGVRFQFSTEANVRLTQLSYRYFTHDREIFGRSVDFVRHGYLFVTTDAATLAQCRENVALQRRLGVASELLAPSEIQAHLASLVTADLLGGTFCADDGSADPYSLLSGFLEVARSRGLRLLTGAPVIGIVKAGARVIGVKTPGAEWSAPIVVDCAGPHADEIGAMAGVDIPSKPYRRQVMVTEPLPELPPVFPLIVDLDTGFYVHRQGLSAVLMGGTDKDIRPGHDTTVDWDAFDAVFRAAALRVPPLAEAQVMRAYAGVRDLTPDYHGILGPAAQAPGFHVACGFSGHGFMHSPAIGILMTEMLLDGRARTMDIGALTLDRFAAGRLRAEANMF